MGSVLRARDPIVGRTVALKCIHAAALSGDQREEYRSRFYREARAAGKLAHPGIVPVFDVGEDDGMPFLVMELVEGRTLGDAMKLGERYSLDQVSEIGQQLAEALGYAHRNGVVHRDVKPANILMTSREVYGAERPRITDFGVAKLAGGDITTTGQLLGTPAFMPPEQFTGAPIDGRTDLFSLGVILYRLATGEQPFSGETITAVSYKIVHTEPIPPSKLNPAIGSRLEGILLKCLAKNPAERYQTGDALAADLSAARSGAQPARAATAAQAAFAGRDPSETIDVGARPAPKAMPDEAALPPWIVPAESPQAVGVRQAVAQAPTAIPAAPPAPVPPPVAMSAAAGAAPVVRSAPPSVPPSPPPASRPVASAAGPASNSGQNSPPKIERSAPVTGPAPPNGRPAMKTAKTLPEGKRQRRGFTAAVWLVLIGLGILGSWYFRSLHIDPKTQQVDSAQSSENGPIAGSPPVAAAPAVVTPPRLDPSQSGRFRLDVSGFPAAVTLTLEMDGKPFWSGTSAGEASGLSVPAGRHEFRMTLYAGSTLVASNTVSGDFAAGKHLLVTSQVHPQPEPGTSILSAASRVTLTLRADPLGL